MPGLEAAFKAVTSLIAAFKGGEKALSPDASVTEHIEGDLGAGSGALGAVGYGLGGSMPAGGMGAGGALLGSGLGAGLLAGSSVLGAGAAGFWVGNKLDKALGLSTKLSDVMTGNLDDELLLKGLIPTHHPGGPTQGEQVVAAGHLAALEAGRQEEIAKLSEMWTDGFGGDMGHQFAGMQLKEKYGIDMQRIKDDEARKREETENTPAARMERETARQVKLSQAIQSRAALPPLVPQPWKDVEIAQILGHYGS